MNNKCCSNVESKYKLYLILILGFNLIIKLLLYYNTTSFDVSEAGSNYSFLNIIGNGERPALYSGVYRSILGYIGYFFKSIFGTLDAFFWFQALIATLSVFILYLICLKVTEHRLSALLTVLLATIFMDYHLLTPVFYYQIFEIFFTLLIVYFILLIVAKHKVMKSAGILLIPIIIYLSILFRGTLTYFWLLLLIISIYYLIRKDIELFSRLAATGIITLLLFLIFPQDHYRKNDISIANDFIFFGHTLYGGDGGEGSFVYVKNKNRYDERLREFMIKKHYNSATVEVQNEFKNKEIREFVLKTPHKWIILQIRKIAYTFGIVPIRDSLKILTTGKLSLKWYLSAIIIQVPFVIIILIFIILITLFVKIADFHDVKYFIIFIVLLYLVAAACLFGHYQERYRNVIIMAGILPVIAFYIKKFIDWSLNKSIKRKRLIVLILFLLIILSHWGYQAYNALVTNSARYINAVKHF